MRRAQALVEFALIAPIVILMAMTVWDGGSVLREQVVLQQAARDGARVAASSYGPQGASPGMVQDAVVASAADLPGLANTPGFLTISYPNLQSVAVRVQYSHALITPVLRQLWGGGSGTVNLSATATFYLPEQTPVPATIVASTPLPTSTPTPIPTATATPTPSVQSCARTISVPPLNNNSGYYVTLQLTLQETISATWTSIENVGGQMSIEIYSGDPFSGQPDPTGLPSATPIAGMTSNAGALSVSTPQSEAPGTYAVFFYKQGVSTDQSSTGTVNYESGTCS